MAELSIIIVNYRSHNMVFDCIQSLKKYNGSVGYEIIVADNDDLENETEVIKKHFPDLVWHNMNYNSGFARANNAGMQMAKGDVFLLLNPDTISIDDSISQAYKKLVESDFIACGVQLFDENKEPQISGNYFMKGGINHILPIPYWGGFLRWLGYQLKTKVPNVKNAEAVQEVDWISGAFLMVKRSAVEKAGMMDEDFFLYGEEVEWCSRLQKEGKLCIFGDLSIIHLEGAAINKDQNIAEKGYYNLYDKKGLQLMVSNHLRVRKQYGVGWFIFLLLNYTWGFFLYFICSTVHRLFLLKNPAGEWSKIFSFGKNLVNLWALSPKIISGKKHFYKLL